MPGHAIVLAVEPRANLPWKTEPAKNAAPLLGQLFDLKRLALAGGLIAVGAALAVWAIIVTVQPGPVQQLEKAPADVAASQPARPATSLDAASRPARDPIQQKQADAPPAVQRKAQPAVGAALPPRAAQGSAHQAASAPPAPETATAPSAAVTPPPALRFETFEQVRDSAVYSALDTDVEPPIAVYPRQLGQLPIGVDPEDLAMIEVLVNADGTVAEVKAKSSPQSLDVAMMLTMSMSAAKTWRFQPAQKAGLPVRYRHVLPVSLR